MSYDAIRHAAGGKAIAYIFDKMVKYNSAGHWQIGARFKGRGDREWIVIYVPSDSDHSYNGFIRLFNQEKGDIVIRPEEMAKAARLLTNFYNSPSLAGNEKRATQSGSQTSPKSVRHSAVDDDEVIDCTEDEVLEHSVTFKNVPFEYYAYTTNIGPYGLHITFRNAKKAELFDAVGDLIHLDFTKYEIYNQFTTIQKFKSGILNKFNEKVVSLRNTYGADSLMAFTKATISSQEASRAAAGGWALITDDPNWGIPTRDKTVSSGNPRSKAIKHSANPYPYRPSVELKGNQLVITFTDVSNNRTATASVNLVGCKNYKDVENRLDTVLTAAYEDGKDWGNISKQAFDSIMSQARALNIFNEKTWANANLAKRSKAQHSYTVISSQDELYHHGILGQKWGVRRYQNADGSLTDAGKKRYGLGDPKYQRNKGIAETETVMKRLNAVRNGKDVYIDKEKFRNSTGDEDEFKTGEAHAKATENYANYLSNSYRMFDSMIPKRMSGKVREEYIKYLLNQTVADLNANHLGTVEKGVKIVYQLDTSRGLDDIDFKLEFEYPDQRKIK